MVGAGNVAVDAARTALRKGSTAVTILNFMGPEEVAAYQDEVELALIDGVEFLHYSKTIRITDRSVTWVRVERVEAEDGSVTFEDDFSVSGDVEADAVIIAVGQGPAADVPEAGLKFTRAGLIETDEAGRTSRPRVFAAGDIVTGPRTVVEAVAHAKLAVEALDERCRGLSTSAVRDLTAPGGGGETGPASAPPGGARGRTRAPWRPGGPAARERGRAARRRSGGRHGRGLRRRRHQPAGDPAARLDRRHQGHRRGVLHRRPRRRDARRSA